MRNIKKQAEKNWNDCADQYNQWLNLSIDEKVYLMIEEFRAIQGDRENL